MNHSSDLPSPGRRQRPDRWLPDGKDPQQTRQSKTLAPVVVYPFCSITGPDVHSTGFGTTGKIIYAFLTYNLAVTVVYTAINLPFGSLAALMTKNQTERGYLNISKMVFAFGGGMVVNAATLPLVKYFGNDSSAWQKTFLIYGVVAIIFFLIVFFTTKEAVTEEAKKAGSEEKVNIPQALKSLIKNKYWMILLAIFFLNSVVNAFIGVNVYYAQYIMNDDSLVGNLSIFQNIASFAAFAVCTVSSARLVNRKSPSPVLQFPSSDMQWYY